LEGELPGLMAAIKEQKLEGLIAKRKGNVYKSDERGDLVPAEFRMVLALANAAARLYAQGISFGESTFTFGRSSLYTLAKKA
jgi:hypothetical protein